MCEYHKGTESLEDAERLRKMLSNWLYQNCWCAPPLAKLEVRSVRDSLMNLLDCFDSMQAIEEDFRADVREAVLDQRKAEA